MAIVSKLEIGRAGAFRRDHTWAHRIFKVTDSTKESALGRGQEAAKNFSASTSGRFSTGDDRDLESLRCIKGSIRFPKLKTALGEGAKAPPFGIADLKDPVHNA